MLNAAIESVLGVVLDFLFIIFWWLVLFPIVWLLSLPFILVIALFRRGDYSSAVTKMLIWVHCFWRDWGILIIP